jgi:hypothetical protein
MPAKKDQPSPDLRYFKQPQNRRAAGEAARACSSAATGSIDAPQVQANRIGSPLISADGTPGPDRTASPGS